MSYHVLHYRLKKLKRSFLIWITLISLLLNLWIDNIRFTIFQTKNNEKSRVQIKRARCFTNQLINLGSAFIKIGQLLSARPDLIPNTWIQELSKLQDQVPNFSFRLLVVKFCGTSYMPLSLILSAELYPAILIWSFTLRSSLNFTYLFVVPSTKV